MKLKKTNISFFKEPKRVDLYTTLIVSKGSGSCTIDSGTYDFKAPALVFISPFQKLQMSEKEKVTMESLDFHGDFYCIEFHKPEVACNGLLFNNIFLSPVLDFSQSDFKTITALLLTISSELKEKVADPSVLVSYLQLFLALTSRLKRKQLGMKTTEKKKDDDMEKFKDLIDKHFLTKRSPSDYAKLLSFSSNNLTKRSKKYFTKSPSELIHERVILEAKKQLHLTRKSVKEIAFALKFEDEHYFSRFFKKEVGLSPQAFRQKAGISRVADLST